MQRYYDESGLVWAMLETPDGSVGLIVGPPDLSSLHIDPAKEKLLREKLVEHDLFNAPAIMGQRPLLFQILQEVGLPRSMIQSLVAIFQLEYDGDGNE